MYRDDDDARARRARALIDEIAELEHAKLAQAVTEQRLEAAKRELLELQAPLSAAPPAEPERPGLATHIVVFGATAAATFVGYSLLF